MVAKGKSIGHGGRGIDYALNKEHAEVVYKNMVTGENGKEIKKEFELFQSLNNRATNKDLSFVVSPTINDGRQLNNNEFREIAKDFMDKMGLKDHQYIVIKHSDKDHTHLHIFANRIDSQGKAYKDNFLSKKAQDKADLIARSRGMERAKDVELKNKMELKQIRKEIHMKHKEVFKEPVRDFKQYCEAMERKGVKVKPTINKQGNIQGFRVEYKGKNLKASQVHKDLSINKMIGIQPKQMNRFITPKISPSYQFFKSLKGLGASIQKANTIAQKAQSRDEREQDYGIGF